MHTADRASCHRARRSGRRPAAHRPQPQRPGGHRPPPLVQGRAARRGRAHHRPPAGPAASGPVPRAAPTSPATPTCSGPSRCCWPTTCWPTGGRSARDVDRLLATVARLDVSPLGAGALAGSSLPLGPRGDRGRPRLRRRVRQQPRRCLRPRLRGRGALRPDPGRDPPLPHGRGVGPLDERRAGLRPPRRRLRHRLVDDAAEEEPRHRRAGAGQGRPGDRRPHRAAGRAEGPARSPTTATCRRTRSRCSTPSTRSAWPSAH